MLSYWRKISRSLALGTLALLLLGCFWFHLSAAPEQGDQPMRNFDCARVTEVPISECNALVALYNNTGGEKWASAIGWGGSSPCGWYGVSCANGHVKGLYLSNNNLDGTLPAQLGDLTYLYYLKLPDNHLHGAIPPELGRIFNVWLIDLADNQLSGAIPATLSYCSYFMFPNPDIAFKVDYNALSADNDCVLAFLEYTNPAWAALQTVAPTNIQIHNVASDTITLTWTPILYTGDAGYYEISYATNPNGPFTQAGHTADKRTVEYTISGLQPPLNQYYYRMRTFTPSHGSQRNDVLSDYSLLVFEPATQVYLPFAAAQALHLTDQALDHMSLAVASR